MAKKDLCKKEQLKTQPLKRKICTGEFSYLVYW